MYSGERADSPSAVEGCTGERAEQCQPAQGYETKAGQGNREGEGEGQSAGATRGTDRTARKRDRWHRRRLRSSAQARAQVQGSDRSFRRPASGVAVFPLPSQGLVARRSSGQAGQPVPPPPRGRPACCHEVVNRTSDLGACD